jgi:acyl dehydratase
MAGLYYEEFEVGAEYRHEWSRTVTETDTVLYCSITMNPAPIHLDAHYMADSIYGQRLVPSLYTAALVGGMIVNDLTFGTTLGNLGYTKFDFPKPVFHGDTIYAETLVQDKRLSRSRPGEGVVQLHHTARNQHGDVVALATRQTLVRTEPR